MPFIIPRHHHRFLLNRSGTGFYSTLLAAALSLNRPRAGSVMDGSGPAASWIAFAIFVGVGLFCAMVIEALRLTVDEVAEAKKPWCRIWREHHRAATVASSLADQAIPLQHGRGTPPRPCLRASCASSDGIIDPCKAQGLSLAYSSGAARLPVANFV
jgi:hypothetical protein